MKDWIKLELKEVGDEGVFKGLASVYDIEDHDGDVIVKGAFKKTISENPTIPILWQHGRRDVIGEGDVREWGQNVTIDGRLDLEDPAGMHAYRKMRGNKARNIGPMVKNLSVGISVPEGKWTKNEKTGGRFIHEVKLWEVSVVTFGSNPGARIMTVKSIEELESEIQSRDEQIKALLAENATAKAAGEAAAAAALKAEEPGDHSAAVLAFMRTRASMLRQ